MIDTKKIMPLFLTQNIDIILSQQCFGLYTVIRTETKTLLQREKALVMKPKLKGKRVRKTKNPILTFLNLNASPNVTNKNQHLIETARELYKKRISSCRTKSISVFVVKVFVPWDHSYTRLHFAAVGGGNRQNIAEVICE